MMARRLVVALVGLALVAMAFTGCSLAGRATGGYRVTAYFQEAVSLYPHAPVNVMGVHAGIVDRVAIDGTRVRVDMTIRHEVPLPSGINATISGLTLIGERSVLLSPPWQPGDDRVSNGFVIPLEHTTTPVEPDQGLKAFIDLIQAIQPKVVSQLISSSAKAFGGHEQAFNDLIGTTANIWSNLSAQDGRLVDAASSLHQLATTVNQRDQQLGHIFGAFSDATSLLSTQRQAIATALDSALRLTNDGSSLLNAYQGTLPGDLANLSKLGLTLQANLTSFNDFFKNVSQVAQGITNAYDPVTKTFRLGANVQPSIQAVLDTTFGRILQRLGLCSLNTRICP
jgi:virulence factor Mce-like protein